MSTHDHPGRSDERALQHIARLQLFDDHSVLRLVGDFHHFRRFAVHGIEGLATNENLLETFCFQELHEA